MRSKRTRQYLVGIALIIIVACGWLAFPTRAGKAANQNSASTKPSILSLFTAQASKQSGDGLWEE